MLNENAYIEAAAGLNAQYLYKLDQYRRWSVGFVNLGTTYSTVPQFHIQRHCLEFDTFSIPDMNVILARYGLMVDRVLVQPIMANEYVHLTHLLVRLWVKQLQEQRS